MFAYKPCCVLKHLFIALIPLMHGCGKDGGGVDARNSKQLFQECVSCHSMAPGRHLVGPSLAGIWGRKAGTAEGFTRYSDALRSSEIVWTMETMGSWLSNPQGLIPGNQMMFKGIQDRQVREELISMLKKETAIPSKEDSPAQTSR